MSYQPPYTITPTILKQVAQISEAIGRLSAQRDIANTLHLRRANRIRTIQGSLAIEGNTLSESQITAILEGKRIIAPPKEVQEVRNALQAYDRLAQWRPTREADLLTAHSVLMKGLIDEAGHYRHGGVGVMSGSQVVHMAPGANQVPRLMGNLFDWLATSGAPPLITSCVFHYEFEFVHPFSDGNGRMGRLWQTLILSQWQPMFVDIPVESLIFQHQAAYYQALRDSTRQTDSAPFIEFMLATISEALQEALSRDEKVRVEMRAETRVKTPEQILALLRRQPELTLAEVAVHLGRATSTIERAVAKLKQQNKLAYHGPKKGGHWQVQEEL
ncbi:MAG: Fic family protein [Pseudomonadales bacterium]|nr:Fic family protein [Pseudomonadales bacterium]